jgi:hypothetical protein
MTWGDELAALSTGGVIAAVGYWIVRRVYARVEEILKQILSLLSIILGKLDEQHPPPPDTLQALHDLNVKRDKR